jgi:hypothetical protein
MEEENSTCSALAGECSPATIRNSITKTGMRAKHGEQIKRMMERSGLRR